MHFQTDELYSINMHTFGKFDGSQARKRRKKPTATVATQTANSTFEFSTGSRCIRVDSLQFGCL